MMGTGGSWGEHRPNWVASLCIGALRRRIARGASKQLVRRVLSSIDDRYDVEVDGLKMRCQPANNFTEQMALAQRAHEQNRRPRDDPATTGRRLRGHRRELRVLYPVRCTH